uniref:Sugar transporter protein 3 [Bombyx mori] n=1 Tax=Lepeophtheirus salmonis TaxID=72036 RepID=A0A0K2VCI0_LEPSM
MQKGLVMRAVITLFSKKDKKCSNGAESKDPPSRQIAQILLAIACALLMGMEGLMTSFAAATLPHLAQEFNIDPLNPWLPFIYFISMAVFTPIGGFISKKIGRQKALISATFPISASLVYMALSKDFISVLVGRGVSAIGFGLVMPSCGVYIAESCHPKYRGPLLSIVAIMGALGAVYTFSFVHFISNDWRLLIWTVCWIPLLSLVMLLKLHESPYWLVEKGYLEEARESMKFYQGGNIETELNSIISLDAKRRVEKSNHDKSTHLFKSFKEFLHAYKKIGILLLIYQWTGNSSLLSFLSSIFQIIFPHMKNGISSVIMSITALISTSLSLFTMRYCRYRILFFVCSLLSMGSSIILATSEYLPSTNPITSYVPIIGISGIIFFSNFGVYPVLYATNTEIYPINIKAQGVAASQSLSFISISINAIVFPALNKILTIYKAFWVYAFCSCLLCFYAMFVLPNNEGKQLSESINDRKKIPKKEKTLEKSSSPC